MLKQSELADYSLTSRVHSLPSFNLLGLECYIKRDDELSCAIAGSKIRKYSSIIPSLIQQKIEEAVIIGGANSNHVLGICQLLIETRIKPTLFLCKSHQKELKGNARLIQLLIPDESIYWIERSQWAEVESIAKAYVENQIGRGIKIIPEGGRMAEALPGALTLAYDITQNENKLGFQFDHVFIDSGTGMTAIGLILGFANLRHPAHIHVLQMADNETIFLEQLEIFFQLFKSKCPCHCPSNFSLSTPQGAKSFGSTTPSIFKFIQDFARAEGVLCDPIYNAKLFIEAKRIMREKNLRGRALIVHSGGTMSLNGFF